MHSFKSEGVSRDMMDATREETSITINETIIKVEPKDESDPSFMEDIGNFLTVLVPENPENVDVKPVKCSVCNAIIELDPFSQVTVTGTNTKSIICKNCQNQNSTTGPSLNSKKALLSTVNNCKNTIPFRCHYCSKTYDTKETFYNHIRLHAAKKKNPYLCGMCGKNFKELIQFKKHICARNVLKCNRCSKQFESIFRLENHYQIHSKHKCDQCGKCLSSKTVLEEHKRVHTNEYPYKCDKCMRQFRQKSKYNAHLIVCKHSSISVLPGKKIAVKSES